MSHSSFTDPGKGLPWHRIREFLAGATNNPLVVGPNVTTRSDERIFNADGGAMMRHMSSLGNFFSTCGSLLERMLNTVQRGVQLGQVITPISVKPEGVTLEVNEDVRESK